VEIGAVAVESEHEEELGVQARGRDAIGGEAGDGGGEGRLQLHLYISTQRQAGAHRGEVGFGRAACDLC
jgi:hypothetical protein